MWMWVLPDYRGSKRTTTLSVWSPELGMSWPLEIAWSSWYLSFRFCFEYFGGQIYCHESIYAWFIAKEGFVRKDWNWVRDRLCPSIKICSAMGPAFSWAIISINTGGIGIDFRERRTSLPPNSININSDRGRESCRVFQFPERTELAGTLFNLLKERKKKKMEGLEKEIHSQNAHI